MPSSLPETIPNHFHFIFGLKEQTEPFHLVFYLCLASCLRVNRPDKVFFYYHHEPFGPYWELIKDRLTRVKVPLDTPASAFNYPDRGVLQYRYAHASDFIRLEKLISHGGIYADMDTLFVNKIPKALFTKPLVLGRENDIVCQRTGRRRSSLCNAFIMSRPGAEFAKKWRAEMAAAFDGTWSNHSTLLPRRLSQEHPDWIHVEPARTFYPYMWTPEDLGLLFKGCETDTSGIASIHLWNHLWWSRKRRDFSDFHAGRITESRIRRIDTTYHLLARPHLPAPGAVKKQAAIRSKLHALIRKARARRPGGHRLGDCGKDGGRD